MMRSRAAPKLLAALVWLGAGAGLALRGAGLLEAARETQHASRAAVTASVVVGLLLGALKGRYVLARTARRNVRRIDALAAPRPWHAFTPRFAVMIALMIGLGVGLRALAARGWLGGYVVVGGLYVGIGMALVTSAAAYRWRRPPPRVDTCAALERARSRPGAPPPVGVLVVNLGTPDAPTAGAVRRYLREFLGDPRVVEVARPLWWFVLNVILLPFRSARSAELYRSVWTAQGSPLLVGCREQARLLARELGEGFAVELAMRYGSPSMAAGLTRLKERGVERVVCLPMFPQYSATTTASVVDELGRCLRRLRSQPAVTVVPPFPGDPDYVAAQAERVREARGTEPVDHTVFSFHGVPEAYVERGDRYLDDCALTATRLAAALGLPPDGWSLAFQSRFGEEPWLQPYTDELVGSLAERGSSVLVATPAFTTDCLETLEEIGTTLARDFRAAGGSRFLRAACLNDHPLWIRAMARFVRAASGVPEPTPVAEPERPSRAPTR